MAQPIEFYFDFSSPYGYFAAHRIDTLAARYGRETVWKPFLLGAVFKATGGAPLVDIPMKGDYARIDLPRTGRMLGLPFTLPSPFPFLALASSRAFYHVAESDPASAKQLALALYDAAFGEGRDIGQADTVLDIAAALGHDRNVLAAAIADPAVKERLKQETDAAIRKGVFGSPFVIVDGEPFWGHDRLAMVEWRLGHPT